MPKETLKMQNAMEHTKVGAKLSMELDNPN